MKIKIIVAMLMNFSLGYSQTFTEKITRELTFEKKGANNALMIFNVNGDVKIEGYEGDKILLEVEKTITAKTEARLEKGKQEIQLGVLDRADTLIVYINGLCSEFGKITKRKDSSPEWNNWGYNWSDCNRRYGHDGDRDQQYDYEVNFTVKVPRSIHLLASTINNGDVNISGVNNTLLAHNINGSIRLKAISGATHASTINGDVELDYRSNPSGDSRYYTLNGDINANFKKGLSANLAFESFNGEMFTNIDRIESLPATMVKMEKGAGTKYKIGGNRFKVGNGGILLDFETFNGDVYLKENE